MDVNLFKFPLFPASLNFLYNDLWALSRCLYRAILFLVHNGYRGSPHTYHNSPGKGPL